MHKKNLCVTLETRKEVKKNEISQRNFNFQNAKKFF
jgi:hypothetical protein